MNQEHQNSESENEDIIVSDSEEILAEYDEKRWGKEEGGENITDGFSFTGKKVFGKATEGLKGMLIKGIEKNINGIKFKVLDARKRGAGLETDIQVSDKKDKGKTVVKIYDSNPKKKTITVSKSKGCDQKFVILLTEKIIKPLIKKFLSGQEAKFENLTTIGKEVNKCTKCNKQFNTSSALKGHTTRIHSKKRKAGTSENEKEMLNISGASIETECSDDNNKKVYAEKCDNCDFSVTASRKYVVLQHMMKHTRDCKNKCSKCDYVCKDVQGLRRHMRDKHDALIDSISPPTKKSKVNRNISVESMEVEESVVEKRDKNGEEECLDSEKMEIENETEIEERRNRSQMWDQKIKDKHERHKIEEEIESDKKKAIEQKKKEEEMQMIRDKKKMKQSLKNKRKKSVKKKENPKIKPVPKNCKHLVKDSDVVYTVPGNGCCAPNCAAAFLFHDEKFGPELRKKMNMFQAEHWFRRYQYITPCSPERPFERRLKGGIVSFTEPEKLLRFLKSSEDAAFMWSDSEDLAVVSDLFQINIRIITMKNSEDKNPTENFICPDESMIQFAELKNVIKEDLNLLHEDDCHFNLIISKDHDLVKLGNLSKRLDQSIILNSDREVDIEDVSDKRLIKDLEEQLKIAKNVYEKCVQELKNKTEEAEILKTEVKDLKEMLGFKETPNTENEEEILFQMKRSGSRRTNPQFESSPVKKRSSESMKTKVCDISNPKSISRYNIDKHSSSNHSEEIDACDICDGKCLGKHQIQKHMEMKHRYKSVTINKEPEYNCESCDFQGTEQSQLNKHINIKHTLFCKICEYQAADNTEMKAHFESKHDKRNSIECRICGKSFSQKWELMSHRKKEHIASVAICKSNLDGNCPFSFERCWWNHDKNHRNDNIQCFVCGESFNTRAEVMVHRKKRHPEIVKPCSNFEGKICRFNEKFCWFKHADTEDVESMEVDNKEKKSENESEQVFQEVLKKKDPPLTRN